MEEMDTAALLKKAGQRIDDARGCDKGRLRRDLAKLNRSYREKSHGDDSSTYAGALRVLKAVEQSVLAREKRAENAPKPFYPPELPITDRRNDIVRAIQNHPVIVLSGETGSGKTTQIPKMCLEAGRGVDGIIGCTQPRRIAALTVASRIGEELGDDKAVGYKIRFHESGGPEAYIRVMTDGILLAEAQSNPFLTAYDTLIIDEAHERSLNIDVLLGMVRRLVDKRQNLKVIITSATLDTEKFSRHFADAPIIEVSGRSYPVEVRYEPAEDDEGELTLAERVALKVTHLVRESPRGDILVFLPTEQDIRDTIDLASRDFSDRLDILPLYARLPASEQKKVFQSGGRRKLVVATNVAETSLTIPGVKYVVDSGLARISRYNPGTGTHALPVDPISRASADQRMGRCGRVEDGVCIRMYSEEDYQSRPRFTAPEIRRTNLAEVILRLLALGISDIESFPFVDPPDPAGIRDGLRTLREIGALVPKKTKLGPAGRGRGSKDRVLSQDGRLMARLPLDPRLAKVLLQADREGCLGDVLPIAAALSLPDPRERPAEKAGTADRAHAVFLDPDSDFLGWLNIWDAFRSSGKKGSYSGKLKKFCTENFLSFRRMREWMDIHRQLTLVMEEHGYRPRRLEKEASRTKNGAFSSRYSAIHRALLSGFLSHIARHTEKGNFQASRNRLVRIHPGSSLAKESPQWIMAAEIVRTSRLFARSAGAIDPDWLVELGSHVAVRSWVNPHWSRKAGAVLATEQVRLYGFLISDQKIVPYGPVQPGEAREIFIRSALVEQDIPNPREFGFLKDNQDLFRKLSTVEEKLRRRDIVAGEDAIAAFYAAHLPPSVLDLGTLNRFIRENGDSRLRMEESDLLTGVDEVPDVGDYPDSVEIADDRWKLSYHFDPESSKDGVTLKIPSGRLSDLGVTRLDWMVPGLLEEKVEALIRGLPKAERRKLIPIAETVREALAGMDRQTADLTHALSVWLYKEKGVEIRPDMWNHDALPEHLKVRLSLVDESGKEIAAGRDANNLATVHTPVRPGGKIAAYRKKAEKSALQRFPEEGVPESVRISSTITLYPALVPEGDAVALRYLTDKAEAMLAHLCGQSELARLYWVKEIRQFRKSLALSGKARTAAMFLGGAGTIEDMMWQRLLRDIFASDIIRDVDTWNDRVKTGGAELYSRAESYHQKLSTVLEVYGDVRQNLSAMAERSYRKAFIEERLADIEEILPSGFILDRSLDEWDAYPRWLEAVAARVRRAEADPSKDEKARLKWQPLYELWIELDQGMPAMASAARKQALNDAYILLQELRVALFAVGEVRPACKVSEARVSAKLDEVRRIL